MKTLVEILQHFVVITVGLLILFIGITAIVKFIMTHISEEKMQNHLSSKGVWGNIIVSGLGALTRFRACSTIPMTVGFLNAKAPFRATMLFLISSPLLNLIIWGMIGVLVGVKVTILYYILSFVLSVSIGFFLEKIEFS